MKKKFLKVSILSCLFLGLFTGFTFADMVTVSGKVSLPEGITFDRPVPIQIFAEAEDHPSTFVEIPSGQSSTTYNFSFPKPSEEYFLSYRINNDDSEGYDNLGMDGVAFFVTYGLEGDPINFGSPADLQGNQIANADVIFPAADTVKGKIILPAPVDQEYIAVHLDALDENGRKVGWSRTRIQNGQTEGVYVLRPIKGSKYTIKVNIDKGDNVLEDEYFYAGGTSVSTDEGRAVIVSNPGTVDIDLGASPGLPIATIAVSIAAAGALAGAAGAAKTVSSAAYADYKSFIPDGAGKSPFALLLNFLGDNKKVLIIGVDEEHKKLLRKMKFADKAADHYTVDLTEDFNYSQYSKLRIRFPKKIVVKTDALNIQYDYNQTTIEKDSFEKGERLVNYNKMIERK